MAAVMRTRLLSLLIVPLSVLAGAPLAAHERIISTPSGLRIRAEVPAGYSYESERRPDGALLFKMKNPVWPIEVTGLIFSDDDPANTTKTWQQDRLITFVADALSIAAEKDYNFRPLETQKGSGQYVVFTSPGVVQGQPLGPGEVAHFVGLIKTWIGTTIVVRILCNDLESPEFKEIMAAFTHSFEKR